MQTIKYLIYKNKNFFIYVIRMFPIIQEFLELENEIMEIKKNINTFFEKLNLTFLVIIVYIVIRELN